MTTRSEALEYILSFSQRLQEYKRNVYQKSKSYQVEILEPPRFYSVDVNSPGNIVEGGDASTAQVARFKGRIVDNRLAHKKFLTDPNDERRVTDLQTRELLVSMHTDIVLFLGSGAPALEEGSTIFAKLEPGDNNYLYNFQTAKMVLVETDSNGVSGTSDSLPPTATNPKESFSNPNAVPGTMPAPAPTTPSSPELSDPIESGNTSGKDLILWFGGQSGYGATYVETQINSLGLNTSDRIWVTVEYNTKEDDARRKLKDAMAGQEINKIYLGAWSGGTGANGYPGGLAPYIAKYGSTDTIQRIILADPAPYSGIRGTISSIAGNTTMHYLKEWWTQTYPNWTTAASDLEEMARTLGSAAQEQTQYSILIVSKAAGGEAPYLGTNSISAQAHIRILQDCLKLVT